MQAVRVANQVVTSRLIGLIGLVVLATTLGVVLRGTRISYADSWRDAEPQVPPVRQVLPVRQEPSAPAVGHRSYSAWSARKAYPTWAAEHPGKECPDTLGELAPYIEISESMELWRYQVAKECGLPAPTDDFEPL